MCRGTGKWIYVSSRPVWSTLDNQGYTEETLTLKPKTKQETFFFSWGNIIICSVISSLKCVLFLSVNCFYEHAGPGAYYGLPDTHLTTALRQAIGPSALCPTPCTLYPGPRTLWPAPQLLSEHPPGVGNVLSPLPWSEYVPLLINHSGGLLQLASLILGFIFIGES